MVVVSFFDFHPYLGKIPILTNIFQMGWNHQLESLCLYLQLRRMYGALQVVYPDPGFPAYDARQCARVGWVLPAQDAMFIEAA